MGQQRSAFSVPYKTGQRSKLLGCLKCLLRTYVHTAVVQAVTMLSMFTLSCLCVYAKCILHPCQQEKENLHLYSYMYELDRHSVLHTRTCNRSCSLQYVRSTFLRFLNDYASERREDKDGGWIACARAHVREGSCRTQIWQVIKTASRTWKFV